MNITITLNKKTVDFINEQYGVADPTSVVQKIINAWVDARIDTEFRRVTTVDEKLDIIETKRPPRI